jgi:hypothetical protein
LAELKTKVAEMMSFLPAAVTMTGFSPMRYSPSYVGVSQPGLVCEPAVSSPNDSASTGSGVAIAASTGGMSSLNPDASNYLPKITQ